MHFRFDNIKEKNHICIIGKKIYLPKYVNKSLFYCLLQHLQIYFSECKCDEDFWIFEYKNDYINYANIYYLYYYFCE